MTAFERLRAEIPPPESPFAAKGDWARIEADLGLALPSDYKTFISTYGSGKICGYVSVYSPFEKNGNWSSISYVPATILMYRSYVESKVWSSIPYPLYPERGGLLPFGGTENCNVLNWLTQGPAEEWELVVMSGDSIEFFNTGYKSLTVYLADLVQQKCGLYPGEPPLDWLLPASFTAINYDSPEWPKP